jgi:hypothetical protein
MESCRLTATRRREVCVHEAGHAVVQSLGGDFVKRLAVAPEGDGGSWTIEGSLGGTLTDLWGVCQTASFPYAHRYIRWIDDEGTYHADRKGFDALMRQIQSQLVGLGARHARRHVAESRRMVRLLACGCLAGPAAEQILKGEEVWLEEPDDYGDQMDDIAKAQAYSWLLPWRNEYEHACSVTEEALRRPDIWERVIRLADELERVGDMEDFDGFLPDPMREWPPSPKARSG